MENEREQKEVNSMPEYIQELWILVPRLARIVETELAKAKQEGRKEAAREIREDLVDDYDIDELSGEFYYVVKVCDGILNEGAEVNHAE